MERTMTQLQKLYWIRIAYCTIRSDSFDSIKCYFFTLFLELLQLIQIMSNRICYHGEPIGTLLGVMICCHGEPIGALLGVLAISLPDI